MVKHEKDKTLVLPDLLEGEIGNTYVNKQDTDKTYRVSERNS